MQQIIIVTKHQFIAKNIEYFLQGYFKTQIIWLENTTLINTISSLNKEDLIIILNDDNTLNNHDIKSLVARVLLLVPPKYKEELTQSTVNIKDIKVLSFPIFLPKLLQVIQEIKEYKTSNHNTYIIEDFKLTVDYGDSILETGKLKEQIKLTTTEGEILQKLFINYPSYVSKANLLNKNWQKNNTSLEIHLFNIKKKLLEYKFKLNIIKNKEGYKLVVN